MRKRVLEKKVLHFQTLLEAALIDNRDLRERARSAEIRLKAHHRGEVVMDPECYPCAFSAEGRVRERG